MQANYTEHLRRAGKSALTIKQYSQVVNHWQAAGSDAAEFVASGNPTASTHNQRCCAIRAWFDSEKLSAPALPTWKLHVTPPRFVSADGLLAWLDGIQQSGPREYAAACLLYSAGLRIGELASLRLQDLDMVNRIVRVVGKGGRVRQVPFDAAVAAPAIAHYLEHVRPGLVAWDSPGNVFLADTGGEYRRRVLTAAVRLGAAHAGLVHFDRPNHQLRHAYATHILAGGVDLRLLQELLGHAHLSTTQIYLAVDIDSIRGQYDNAHPLAQVKQPARNFTVIEPEQQKRVAHMR